MASTFRPGVEIQQVIRETPTLPNPPALAPVIVGPCYQIINILKSDGSLDSTAKSSVGYKQAALSFTQSQVPHAGRDNLDEIDILEEEVSVGIQYGGLHSLDRGSHSSTGSAFLGKFPEGSRAAIVFPGIQTFTDSNTSTITTSNNYIFDSSATSDSFLLVLEVNGGSSQTIELNKASYTGAELADVINNKGITGLSAADITINNESFCVIYSTRYGSRSSIKILGGASALKFLFGSDNALGTGNADGFEVFGSGIATLDDQDGDNLTPFFTYSVGSFSRSASPNSGARTSFTETAFAGSYSSSFTAGLATAKNFISDIPLKACSASNPGDVIISGGIQLLNAEVYTVDEDRFTLAVLDTENSTYDASSGKLTKRKYIPVEAKVFNQFATTGHYAYAIAQNLTQGSGSATPAIVTGTTTPTVAESAATLIADNGISGTLALTGKTVTIVVTIDGVEGSAQVHQFSSALSTTAAAAEIQSNISGITAEINSDGFLVLKTSRKGADQKLSFTMSESTSAGSLLGFDSSQTKSGVDFGFGDLATLASLEISLPMPSLNSVTLSLSDGVYSKSVSSINLSTATTLGDLVSTIVSSFGGTGSSLLYNGEPFLTVEADDSAAATGSIIFKSITGGSTAQVEVINAEAESVRALGFADSTGSFKQQTIPLTEAQAAALTGAKNVQFTVNAATITYTTSSLSTPTRKDVVDELNAATPVYSSNNTEKFVFIDTESDSDGIIVRCITSGVSTFSTSTTLGTTPSAATDVSGASDSASGANVLVGETFEFFLDDNPTSYKINLTSDSLADLVELVNSESSGVGGSSPIASLTSTGALVITSAFNGLASRVKITASTAATTLGLSTSVAEGAGRPDPNFYIDGSGVIYIGANILRNNLTGTPEARKNVDGSADIYIGYKALRKDVSSSSSDPSLLTFSNASQLEAVLGPINAENPLAMAAFLALANSPLVDISVLGVDEVSSGSPNGTVTAYSKALSYLESQDVYCLAPLTDSLFVCQLFSVHVQAMSQPSERSERICFLWQPIPSRDTDVSIQSGTAGETNGTDNEFLIESTPISALVSAGISDTLLDADNNVYIEVVLVSAGKSDVRNYSVKEVDGPRLVLRTSFSSGENDDGFYSETSLNEDYEDVTYSLRVRGDKLVLKGTEIADRAAQASAAGSLAGQFASRRVFLTAFNSVDTIVDGIVFNVPGYYVSAAIAGMVAQQAPQQPFTNVSIAGFSKVYGTDDTFTENQLDIVADGGRYVIINQNGAIASRHQRSTATLSIESRELSITKAIDFIAKGLRNINKNYIGRFVITPGFLDQLTMVNQGFLLSQEQAGTVTSATLNAVLQDEDAPDTVLIEIQVQPAYPCNKINITILS